MSVPFVDLHILPVLTASLTQKNIPKVTAPGKLVYIDDGNSFDAVL